jgi:hypothetical protein
MVEIDQEPQIYTTQQENSKKKKLHKYEKISNFDRQTALFNGASMGAIT